jgi:hypothetical protein
MELLEMDIQTRITLAAMTVGAIVWLVRLEGRVNGHDDLIRIIRSDLDYIRGRIDMAIRRRDNEDRE